MLLSLTLDFLIPPVLAHLAFLWPSSLCKLSCSRGQVLSMCIPPLDKKIKL